MGFLETVETAKAFLARNHRVSLRALAREFGLENDALDELVEELVDVQQVAAREGKVLSWIGSASEMHAAAPPPLDALAAPDAERRQLTVMFCDLVGSTDLSQRLDAEDLRSIVRAYQDAASGAIERYSGHIAQYLGDGLLVYFGYPQAHEDDAERAVRAGLEILVALRTLNETIEPEHSIRLFVRVGIHTGPVVIGAMGGGASSETLALGDTTNIAARLEAVATPDTVVMSGATQRLVPGLFMLEDLGTPPLKGVATPIRAYAVSEATGVRSRLRVAAGRLTRFVGRDIELATLVDRWERAAEGEGQNVVVLGEAGVGKSRLAYQLHEHLAAVPHTWLECGGTPYTEGTPFRPVIEVVARGLAFTPEDSEAEKLAKVELGLRTVASAETVALLADFLGLTPPTRLQLSPELQRRKTIDLLVQWTLFRSARQPLILLIEDLHWCDASTLELLGHLIAQRTTARMLVLATARPEFTPPWPARSNLTIVQLARLTRRHARDMIAALAGTELPAATLDALVARADGVPLYIEELAKAIAEPGAARGAEAIPASLADSMMARLDRLSSAKEIAQRAAVLGREFEYGLLVATAGVEEAALRRGLMRLVEAEILFALGEPPVATYIFKHALIQETAYQSLLKRTRQQLHARVAQVLEADFPERVASEPEVIARHYHQAGLAAAASAHYRRAGERATQRSANEEAIGHLRRALDLVATLPETRERHKMELGLQMALGAPLGAVRGWSHPEFEGTYTRARELASRVGDSAELPRILVGVAIAYLVKGNLAAATEIAQESLEAAERTGDAFDLLSAHYVAGVPLVFQGHFSRALEHHEQSIRLYEPSVHGPLAFVVGSDRGVFAHTYAIWCHVYLGHPDRALALSEAAVALARRVDHPLSLANVLYFAGLVHGERGEIDPMRARAEEVLDLAERLGFPNYLGLGKVLRGFAAVESGEGEAGLAEMQDALVELARIGSGLGAPAVLRMLAEGLQKAGRHDEALRALGLAAARAQQQGQHFYDAELHRLRAEILLDTNGNAVEEAQALFGQALEIARRQEAKTFELRAAISLARLWQRQGKRDAAQALLAPVYEWFSEGFDTRDLKDAKALLAELS